MEKKREIITMDKEYYIFYLEVALKKRRYPFIYAFENVSHIPTKKLVEIFNIDLKSDPQLIEGYFLTKNIYKKNKKYIEAHFPSLEFKIFEYCLRQYVVKDYKGIRKMYKEDLME